MFAQRLKMDKGTPAIHLCWDVEKKKGWYTQLEVRGNSPIYTVVVSLLYPPRIQQLFGANVDLGQVIGTRLKEHPYEHKGRKEA